MTLSQKDRCVSWSNPKDIDALFVKQIKALQSLVLSRLKYIIYGPSARIPEFPSLDFSKLSAFTMSGGLH